MSWSIERKNEKEMEQKKGNNNLKKNKLATKLRITSCVRIYDWKDSMTYFQIRINEIGTSLLNFILFMNDIKAMDSVSG